MRQKLISALTIMALAPASVFAVEQGDAAPGWLGRDFAGSEVAFPQVAEGSPAVVVFWATWCGYCRAFMPYLKDIQADYAGEDVKIIAINAKEDGEGDPRLYMERLGFPAVAVADGDMIAEAYAVEYIPGLFVVDGEGVIAYRRPWTDLPAGSTVAELWSQDVREVLDRILE